MSQDRREWVVHPEVRVPEPLRGYVGGHPLLAQTLTRRGIDTPERAAAYLDPACYTASNPGELPDLETAVERLETAIRRGEPVCVWGDFDVDGQTSTTLFVSVLRELGADTRFYIPKRKTESHGVSLDGLERVIATGARVVLTCDTGISAHEAANLAGERGVDFLITDHHELPGQLPRALTAVNPRRLPDGHSLGGLPGVGVAYQVALSLCRRFDREDLAENQLDLVALGIVADLAPLTGDTRYLLQRGLARLRRTHRSGLLALFELSKLECERISEEHIGFMIGPRLNALGRLADANLAVEFLTTQDPAKARIMAVELEGLNAQRRLLCEQVYCAARAQIDRDPTVLDGPALVLAHPSWPGGVIGIVASRLVEEYHRPTVLISCPPGETARGSARSIEGCHLTQAISEGAHLLSGYGGHAMAAGLGLDPDNIQEFRRIFFRAVAGQIGIHPRYPDLMIDAELRLSELNLEFVEELERLSPFGPGNPSLILSARDVVIKKKTPVGKNGEHLQLVVEDIAGCTQKVIWWQGGTRAIPSGRFDLAFTVRSSDYQGVREVQIEWIDFHPAAGEPDEITMTSAGRVVEDHRRDPDANMLVQNLAGNPGVIIWGEADQRMASAKSRTALVPCEHLILWTAPPGNIELQKVLDRVNPARVTVIGRDPEITSVEPFLKQLGGLVKYAIRQNGGKVDLEVLAGSSAQRSETVQAGLDWLSARGWCSYVLGPDGIVTAQEGAGVEDPSGRTVVEAQLRALLSETAAYRTFFRQASSIDRVI